jgi:hypothetical protein
LHQHTLDVHQDLVVPVSHDAIAEVFERSGAPRVRGRLICMLTTIEFHNQASSTAHEIDDVGSDRFLSRELMAGKTSIAKMAPQKLLGVGAGTAEFARPTHVLFLH